MIDHEKLREAGYIERVAAAVSVDPVAAYAYRWLWNSADVPAIRKHYMEQFVASVLRVAVDPDAPKTKRMATARDSFEVGDYFRWAGKPFNSMVIRGHSQDNCGAADAHIDAGMTVEFVLQAQYPSYLIRPATPEQA